MAEPWQAERLRVFSLLLRSALAALERIRAEGDPHAAAIAGEALAVIERELEQIAGPLGSSSA